MRIAEAGEVHTREDLLAAGWSTSAIDRAVHSGRLHKLRAGMYCAPPATHPLLAVAAAQASHGVVISHRSAALLLGLTLLGPPPKHPQITVRPGSGTQLAQTHIHRATLQPVDIVEVGGVPVTSPARTLVDLARSEPLRSAVVSIDAALHCAVTTREDLDAVRVRCWNWPGIRRAHRAIALADARAESPLESISRLVLGWLGLPAPALQVCVRTSTGVTIARADFGWPAYGVLGEADGLAKYDEPNVLAREKLRQEAIENEGFVVVRWTWDEITRRPFAVRQRMVQAFTRAAALRRSGFVPSASLDAA